MRSTKRLRFLLIILVLSLNLNLNLPAIPVRASMSGSTVNYVTPDPMVLGVPTNLCFNTLVHSPDDEYMIRFQVNLPDDWIVNFVTPSPSNTDLPTEGGVDIGNLVYWQTAGYPAPGTTGAWNNLTLNFCANVTVLDSSSAPWSLPWSVIGENYASAPHTINGSITLNAPSGPALGLNKSVTPTDVPYHSVVTYTLALRNAGLVSDTAVLMTDTLPTAVDFGWWIENPGASIANGTITWTGTITNNTTLTFTFAATHTGTFDQVVPNTAWAGDISQTISSTAVFTVPVNPNAPVLDPIGNQTLDELTQLSFSAHATDADSPVLTYTLDTGSAGAITTDGYFQWISTEADGPGVYSATVYVTDGVYDDSETISITVNEVNTAPQLEYLGYRTVNELSTLSFMVPTTDTDIPTNTLTYWMDEKSAGSIDPATGRYTWTPRESDGFGVYTATIHVSDGQFEDSELLIIVVFEVTQPPALMPIGDKIVDALTPFFFTARIAHYDIPLRPMTYTLAPGSVGTIDPGTGAFRWTPGAAPETYTTTVQVTDGTLTDTETIHLTVNTDTPAVGHWILVANSGQGTTGDPPPFTPSSLRIIDTTDDQVYGPFLNGQLGSEGGGRFDLTVTPDGRTALVSNFGDSTIFLIDMTNPISPSIIASVTIPMFAEDIDISADSRYALVTDGGFSPWIDVIDIPAATLVYTANLGSASAQAVEVAPNGTVIVANYFEGLIHTLVLDDQGRLDMLNTYTYTHTGIPITDTDHYHIRPVNLGLSPDGQTLIVCDALTTTVGVFKLVSPGVLTFTGEVTGLQGTYDFYTNTDTGEVLSHGAVQSIAFNAAGDKAYALVNALTTAITTTPVESGHRIGVLDITGPGQVRLAAGGVVTLPHYGPYQLFGVDVLAVAGNKLYAGYPALSGAVDPDTGETNVAVVDLTDYSVTTTMVLTSEVSVPVGVAALPLRLNLHQTADTSSLIPNHLITYTLALSNAGPQIAGITLRDLLPSGVEFVGPITITPPTAGNVNTGTPDLITDLVISAYQQITVTFPARALNLMPGTIFTNTARAESPKLITAAQANHMSTINGMFLPLILRP